MVEVPGERLVNMPAEPIVATDVLVLVQAPPEEISVSVAVCPLQIAAAPVIASGTGLTVTFFVTVAEHPKPFVTSKVTGIEPETV